MSCIIRNIIIGLFIPLFGTSLGALSVILAVKKQEKRLQQCLCGSAAGIMVAASIWSLIIPAVEYSSYMGKLSFLPAVVGFVAGIAFMCAFEAAIRKIEEHISKDRFLDIERKNILSYFAVTLHNFPEGLAVGMVFVSAMQDYENLFPAAMALSAGIALQNIPEGAIISMPLYSSGMKKSKAVFLGVLSGVPEPLAAIAVFFLSALVKSTIAYLLCFAAGAMMYVVLLQLVDGMKDEKGYIHGLISFTFGFCLMMSLDIALG